MSRIWKPCGSAASFQCARRKRLHRPWKVPTHMPRTGIGSIADRRVSISLAALLVKVTAITPAGETWPVWISQAMRVVSTRVLPEPAPARISAGLRRQRHRGELLRVEAAQQAAHVGRRRGRLVLLEQRNRGVVVRGVGTHRHILGSGPSPPSGGAAATLRACPGSPPALSRAPANPRSASRCRAAARTAPSPGACSTRCSRTSRFDIAGISGTSAGAMNARGAGRAACCDGGADGARASAAPTSGAAVGTQLPVARC